MYNWLIFSNLPSKELFPSDKDGFYLNAAQTAELDTKHTGKLFFQAFKISVKWQYIFYLLIF